MFKIHLNKVGVEDDVDFDVLTQLTAGYSGADLKIVCRDASMMPMRRLVSQVRTNQPVQIVANRRKPIGQKMSQRLQPTGTNSSQPAKINRRKYEPTGCNQPAQIVANSRNSTVLNTSQRAATRSIQTWHLHDAHAAFGVPGIL
jgi:SpoVK/Ycf46/Vps4 family AAA+-type ATPase